MSFNGVCNNHWHSMMSLTGTAATPTDHAALAAGSPSGGVYKTDSLTCPANGIIVGAGAIGVPLSTYTVPIAGVTTLFFDDSNRDLCRTTSGAIGFNSSSGDGTALYALSFAPGS